MSLEIETQENKNVLRSECYFLLLNFPFKTLVMASLQAVFKFVEMLPTCYYANKRLRTLRRRGAKDKIYVLPLFQVGDQLDKNHYILSSEDLAGTEVQLLTPPHWTEKAGSQHLPSSCCNTINVQGFLRLSEGGVHQQL